jgi:hypothetical protein
MLSELDERNVDNVARTESYLELYALTRATPHDLPWLLMAHMVSRNAGFLMTRIAEQRDKGTSVFRREALEQLFLFLERANHLIFYDAWHHVIHYLLGKADELSATRTPAFVRDAWRRYRAIPPSAERERMLVLDLVHNEQRYIHRRVATSPRFATARAMVRFTEHLGREAPLWFPASEAAITVGRFESLDHRIDAGRRIFDEVLQDRERREHIYRWARAHSHSGSRADIGGKPGPSLRQAWPVAAVRALDPTIHDPAEPDPDWP